MAQAYVNTKKCKQALKMLFQGLVFFCTITGRAQDSTDRSLEIYRKPGIQLGYAYTGVHKIDAGANYYWTIVKDLKITAWEHKQAFHTFGPSAGPNILVVKGKAIVGMQAGMNYHLYYVVCPRLNMNYENYFNGDQRIGAELGISSAGFFTYAGYYPAIGSRETIGVTTFRFGLRFIFNLVLIDASPPQ